MSYRRPLCGLLLGVLLVGLLGTETPTRAQESSVEASISILVFSKTEGAEHGSIQPGIEALQDLGTKRNIRVDTTTDSSTFTTNGLAPYEAVVFLNTAGDVLSRSQQRAFQAYIQDGHGFVGIHSAAATELDWDWFGTLVGARADDHAEVQPATVHVSDPVHPATNSLPVQWNVTDGWYNYRSSPRGDVHVLATLDEQSYEGGTMGPDHPIAWAHEFDGGRSFYTGAGHTGEIFADSTFRRHLRGGIEWAAGRSEGDAAATVNSSYEKVVLDSTTTDPMDLDVAPDGRVFYIERRGVLRIWDPETERRTLAGYLPVNTTQEDGLIGLALSPNFSENRHLYLYYSPIDGPPRNQLSRFSVTENTVDLDSEEVILRVPTQREECCHTGGSIAFGPDGEELYLSTGDDTNPFASSGYAPIDERPDRKYWDAQRTSANTQDLRGKILRIVPTPDGSYEIPAGNLFSDSTRGRPEIYVMGLRNPYRISVDSETGWLYWGDIGPDASAPDSARGPAGHDEFNRARRPGNYGWPYFIGDNKAYHEYDFAADTAGRPFNPKAPVNNSPNNTGARTLPPAQPPLIWYPYGPSDRFPEMGAGSRSAMVGPVYHSSMDTTNNRGLPKYFDESLLIYEWGRNWIKEVTFDSTGAPAAINPLFTDKSFIRPMDVELGPEKRLYVLQWGNNFNGGPNSQIVRLDYYGSPERPPIAEASAKARTGPAPRDVTFSADTSAVEHSTGDVSYEWDVDGDGTTEAHGPLARHTFDEAGRYTARLTVTDRAGRTASDSVSVVVGNTAPTVSIEWPLPGGIVPFDTSIPYHVEVSDPEDDRISADRIRVQSFLGRDSHELPLDEQKGSTGTFRVARTPHYTPKERLFAAVEARYTDSGAPLGDSLEGRARVHLHPQQMEAELASIRRNVEEKGFSTDENEQRRRTVTFETEAYIGIESVNLRNIDAFTLNVAPLAGGVLEVRRGSPEGPLLTKVRVPDAPSTGIAADSVASDLGDSDIGAENDDWKQIRVSISDPGEAHTLYLVARGEKDAPLFHLDWFQFKGPGMREKP